MRITLLHNPGSGYGRYPEDRLLDLLRENGYEPTYREIDSGFEDVCFEDVLDDPGELLVVAGGDGTLGEAAKAMASRPASRQVPLAVLPLGTANNTARALGWTGAPEEIIPAWPGAQPQPLDVGLADGPWGRKPFLEAAGLGLFPEAMTHLSLCKQQHEKDLKGAEEELALDLSMMARALEAQRARPVQITLDGEDLSGEYLMVEAMNLDAVGPRLPLNAKGHPSDGVFELVVLTEAERPRLTDHLKACAEANRARQAAPPPPPELSMRRGQHLRIDWQGQPLHADSQVWQSRLADDETAADSPTTSRSAIGSKAPGGKADLVDTPATVELHLLAGALRFLVRS